MFFLLPCEVTEPRLICFFTCICLLIIACNREIQHLSLFFKKNWLFVVKKIIKISGSGRVRALHLTVPLGFGSGRVRWSRVRVGFGLQFKARADLYPPLKLHTTKILTLQRIHKDPYPYLLGTQEQTSLFIELLAKLNMFIIYSDCVSLEDFLNHMYYFYNVFMYFLRCEKFGGMDFKGVIWCDFKFCFLFGVLQADCA